MIAALRIGRLGHAALDVFTEEPLPAGHALATLPNVTLSAHSAFRTPEAQRNPDPPRAGHRAWASGISARCSSARLAEWQTQRT